MVTLLAAAWRWTSSAHTQHRSYSTRCREVVSKSPYPASGSWTLAQLCCSDNLLNMTKKKRSWHGGGGSWSRTNVTRQEILRPTFRANLNEWFNPKIPFLFLSLQTAFQRDKNIKHQLFFFFWKCNYNTKGRPRWTVQLDTLPTQKSNTANVR